MNGEPPKIEVAFWLDGELQLSRTYEIARFGCVPGPGDIITTDLHEYLGALRVRRRVFVPMAGEQDIWWLVCDQLPDDPEIESLLVFDKEMRAELKELEEEARKEVQQETARKLWRLTLEKSKRPSHKKQFREEFGEEPED